MRQLPDLELSKRFNVPTPRYTSYPTALSFEDFDASEVWHHERAGQSDSPLSLYFHMPFCRKLCWYCACSKVITGNQELSSAYLDRLFKELDLKRDLLAGRPLIQMHLGGGTPSFFTGEELARLVERVRDLVSMEADAELSIEIDPRELSREQVQWIAEAGFNRASLGVQDHNPEVQKLIHREQPYEMTRAAAEWLREAGIERLNFDLIYGLPGQTPESFNETINDVIGLSPDRLAVYSYAHVPWVAPAQKLLERAHIPGPDEKIELFGLATRRLLEAGYEFIGIDHFAKPDDELAVAARDDTLHRNFMGYTTRRGAELHGIGVTSISQTADQYFQNERELEDWEAAIDSGKLPIVRGVRLDEDDQMRRSVIMAIMCRAHVRFDDVVGIESAAEFRQVFEDELASLDEFENEGLVKIRQEEIEILPLGRFFVRNIARVFDGRSGGGGQRFSKAI